jgi:hypothetical protein
MRRPPEAGLERGTYDEAPIVLLERCIEIVGNPESKKPRCNLFEAMDSLGITERARLNRRDMTRKRRGNSYRLGPGQNRKKNRKKK